MKYLLAFAFVLSTSASAHEIQTNSVHMPDAPSWLTRNRAEKVIDRIQMHLEWSIRKVKVLWYKDEESFRKAHELGPQALAVTKTSDGSIHMSPRVTNENFDRIFGHELVHVIFAQKYKTAIPKYIEEGLANHLAKFNKVNYAWLAKQPFPADVRSLSHPFKGSAEGVRYHYAASQALAEMITSKCDLANLLRLSVGMNMDDYLKTYCEIPDLNAAFKKWVMARGG